MRQISNDHRLSITSNNIRPITRAKVPNRRATLNPINNNNTIWIVSFKKDLETKTPLQISGILNLAALYPFYIF
jgi:hypothetical protein